MEKSRLELIPAEFWNRYRQEIPSGLWFEMGIVMAVGAKKYSDWDWYHCPLKRSDVIGGSLRHLILSGEEMGTGLDSETGMPHLAHALCRMMFLWIYVLDSIGLPEDLMIQVTDLEDDGKYGKDAMSMMYAFNKLGDVIYLERAIEFVIHDWKERE